MNLFVRSFLGLYILFFIPSANANTLNLYGGINSTLFSGNGNWDKEYGFDFGALYLLPMGGSLSIRTGAGIGQRNGDFVTGFNTNTAADFTMIEIPATALFQFTDRWAVFGGITTLYALDDDDVSGAKTLVFDFSAGLRWAFFGPHLFEFVYETGITDVASGSLDDFKIKQTTSVRYVHNLNFKKK